jgi:two-component system cell cycle sensor histidine kinase/response regulator CckA
MPEAQRADLRRGETILLVDDEPSIRRAGSRMFGRFGYRVLTAQDGREAVACLEQQRAAIDVVVTDMVMPNMDARDLIGIIRRRWPDLPVVLSTGYDAGRLGQDDLRLFSGLVPKPYTPEQMLRAVRKALDGRG